eukprot:EG_transcript_277
MPSLCATLALAVLWGALGLPSAHGVQLLGSGSVLPFQVLQQVQFPFRFVSPDTEIQYTPTSSAGGECRITSPQSCAASDTVGPFDIDFAGVTQILPAADYARYPDLQLYPILAGPLVPVYNLLGWQGLVLTTTVMVQIFAGEITVWGDRRITQLNPNLTMSGVPPNMPIEVVVTMPGDELTDLFEANLQMMYPNFTGTAPGATRMPGLMPMIAYVMQKPFTLGFSGLDVALAFQLPTLKLRKGAKVVEASVLSTTYAVLELGLSFGNNGDDPAHLTANVANAQGVDAWPMVGFGYLAVRKDTLRPGATCAHRQAFATFLQWFLTSDIVEGVLKGMAIAPLPSVVRDVVLGRFISDFRCNGTLVWAPQPLTAISGTGTPLVAPMFQRLAPVYHGLNPGLTVTYDAASAGVAGDGAGGLGWRTFLATTADVGTAAAAGAAKLLFAGVGLVAVSQYRLVLDLATLTRILNGDVATWGHPDLLRLNPGGIRHMYTGQALGNQSILLLRGPTFDGDLFRDMMALSPIPYTGLGLRAAVPFANENVLRFSVAGIPFSLTVTVFTGDFTATTLANVRRADGTAVAPSWPALQACASPDAFDLASGTLRLPTSQDPACYPWAATVYLLVPRSQCNNTTDPNRTRAGKFVEWLFSGAADGAVQEQLMAPLRAASPAIAAANALALRRLSCDPSPLVLPGNDLPWGPILGGCLGGLLALVVLIGWYMWRSSRELRAMRKQVSDITVARDCAEAIARFDLESVEWLHSVPRPTPIQLAFVRIVGLLTEVRPFIPDQLLSALQRKDGLAPDDAGPEAGAPSILPPSPLLRVDSASDGSGARRSSDASRVTSHPASHPASLAKGNSYRKPAFYARSLQPPRVAAGNTGVRKATYLYVKFGVGEDWEALDQAAAMGAAGSHIVGLGKAQEATVDKVTFDSVSFHWNVSSNTGTGPFHATLLATEVAKVWDAVEVPAAGRPWVRVSVGCGPSVVGTVSAAKQRFFVIGGPQVALAIEVVTKDCSAHCQATILLTNEVYKEVRLAVHCFPRLWLGPELLWEPVTVRTSVQEDEWMYQLQSLESTENERWNGQALAEVFLMVRDGKPPSAVRQAAAEVRRRYGDALTAHDVASLDHLVAQLPVEG